jgi:hypothetical protein
MASLQEYALLSVDSYFNTTKISGPQLENWTVLNDISFPEAEAAADEGFYARAYKHEITGEIVIAYRGSDGATDIDESFDAYINGDPPDQLYYADKFYQAVRDSEEAVGATISVTGHSLAGGLAAGVEQRRARLDRRHRRPGRAEGNADREGEGGAVRETRGEGAEGIRGGRSGQS